MYDIIPLSLILISLSVIIIIVFRKFPVLANMDVENIPAEKEAKFKERIISNRLKRTLIMWWSKITRLIYPGGESISKVFKWLYNKLHELKESHKQENLNNINLDARIEQLFNLTEEFKKSGDFNMAEKKLIEIIGLDSKNIEAFKLLGKIYFERQNYEEAKQTFEHILKLKEDDEDIYDNLAKIAQARGDLNQAKDEYLKLLNVNKENAQTYFNLTLVYQAMGNMKEAVKNIKKALKIEPNNPRFLDTKLEISIIIKDKVLALDAFNKLQKVNPENQKIVEFKKQIDEI